jgi:hypothetical protein
VATQILVSVFESTNFDIIIALVWRVHSEIALILIQKLLAIYPVNYGTKEKNEKFIDLFVTCCTHFTDVAQNGRLFNAAASLILEISDKVFDQLKIAQEENSDVLKCIDMYLFFYSNE